VIRTEVAGVRGYIWLDAPERRNAMDGESWRELVDAVQVMELERQVRTIVLGATGSVFCAGAQVDWMRTATREQLGGIGPALARLGESPKPVVARVHGSAYGGGVGLIAACDLVVASRDARFVLSEVRLGLAPATISRAVVRRIGGSRFRVWAMTARHVTADEALAAGLVDYAVDPDQLDATIDDVCSALCAAEPGALAAVKKLFPDGLDGAAATHMLADLKGRPAFAEGIAALREKRPPSWVSALAGGGSG
jgi:methylglutaconyl-CoA hydratase